NGEQSFNLQQVEAAGGAVAVLDADFEPSVVTERLIPLLLDRQALNGMSKAAKSVGISDGATRLYGLIRGVLN
ncbi:MAG: UDP-N-acetylglucosamine-N-acetylmuramyl-(pentapeptide) pyrophosphoryl-undecaprenol, partial [Actinomycetota bacterium]